MCRVKANRVVIIGSVEPIGEAIDGDDMGAGLSEVIDWCTSSPNLGERKTSRRGPQSHQQRNIPKLMPV